VVGEEELAQVAYVNPRPDDALVSFPTAKGSALIVRGEVVHFGAPMWHGPGDRFHERTVLVHTRQAGRLCWLSEPRGLNEQTGEPGRAVRRGSVSSRASALTAVRVAKLVFKRFPGCRAQWRFGACGESAGSKRERTGTCEIGCGDRFVARRDIDKTALRISSS
jgi:hypothetical protein